MTLRYQYHVIIVPTVSWCARCGNRNPRSISPKKKAPRTIWRPFHLL